LDKFYIDNAIKDGHANICKECCQKRDRNVKHIEVTEKVCTKCNTLKKIDEYPKDKSKKDGHLSQCKACRNKSVKGKNVNNKKQLDELKTLGIFVEVVSKVCPHCKVEKKIEKFARNKYRTDGHSVQCKDCIKAYNQKYYKNYQESDDKEYLTKRTIMNNQANARNLKIKLKVLKYYSHGEMKCANPYHLHSEEITNHILLTIDHINGEGYKERDNQGKRLGGSAFYRKMVRLGFPEGMQVLCWNCQMYKRHENKEYNAHYKRNVGVKS
jgi:hypothetical protein